MAMSKQRAAVFASGFFGLGLVSMMTVAVPLWAIELGIGPLTIGLVLGARAAPSVLFSIPGGALMDRLSTNRIMAAAATASAVGFPLYPVLPRVEALILLQMLTGFAQGLLWMGAQAHVSRLRGSADAGLMGRFTLVSTSGNLVGPLLCGAASDIWGLQAGFLVIGLWSAAALATTAALPRPDAAPGPATPTPGRRPAAGAYAAALRMLAAPAVGFVIACSFLMTCTHALRHSFYPVYLESLGLTGTLIALLVAAGSVVSGLAGLTTGIAARRFDPNLLLLAAVALTTLCISQVVLFEAFWSLFGMAVLWGAVAGIAFPLMLYALARAVDSDRQGMSVGIRTTVNRAAGLVVPVAVGAVVDLAGIEAGFYIFAVCILGGLGTIAWRLLPGTRARNGPGRE